MANTGNAIMFWHDGVAYRRITDHNRAPLVEDYERIERKQRMADGTLRRHTVAKKRTWSTSWESLPRTNTPGAGGMTTADGGWAGQDIETFHDQQDGSFNMQLRHGDGTIEGPIAVMISDYSREVYKRGANQDLWNISITLEEV
jgi:hypothetical protein